MIKMRLVANVIVGFVISGSWSLSPPISRPFREIVQRRQEPSNGDSLAIDLGYEIYQGFYNASTDLNTWFGVRYAAPPLGNLRFQAPQIPASNRSNTITANQYGPRCPQSANDHLDINGAGPDNGTFGDEDCLFLNVYTPANKRNLPVLFWIHGGGYGEGDQAEASFPELINANGNAFVGVEIQYRLGAFGFLSSDEVFREGAVNAGLLDQYFALEWVQAYISEFGGNASAVTIFGESAGGGSVMLLDMAYGGTVGSALFQNSIAASPYLPMQYGYKDWVPSQAYYAFATQAGCPPQWAYGNSTQTIFQCLVAQPSDVLQRASFSVSASGLLGTWAFLPVTDGVFVQQRPSQQLLKRKVNGQNALIGNNANEGVNFAPQNITTEDDLVSWMQRTFPVFTTDDIAKILLYYPSSNASVDPNAAEYATLGYTGATAVNESQVGTGQQQRANDIYAETTFVCPAYWIAEAYTGERTSYKYQYSVPLGGHGEDALAYFGPARPEQGPDFVQAFRQIIGNFVTTSNPSISAQVANGVSSSNPNASNPATSWPPFSLYSPYQLILNETGGSPYEATPEEASGAPFNVTQYEEPGLMNDFTLQNAYKWEGGRGMRCDFWRSVGSIVPE